MSDQSDGDNKGLRVFLAIWAGQLLSIFGSTISAFGLTLWAYDKTKQATPLALVTLFFMLPMVILSPITGALVDRFNRKLMMILSDAAAASMTLMIFIFHSMDRLEIWHIYLAAFVIGTFQGLQWPAYSAVISTMVPKQHFARTAALIETAGTMSGIFGPILAAALIGPLKLRGLLLIDLTTATLAILILLFVHIPQPKTSEIGASAKNQSVLKDALWGLNYVLKRPSLAALQTVFTAGNFFWSLAGPIFPAMILARTNQNVTTLGFVNSAGAVGGLLGGLLMGIWGGPKKRVYGVLGGWLIAGLCNMVFGLGQSLPVWSGALVLGAIGSSIINGSNQGLWQSKVPPDVQGRVFGIRRFIAQGVSPIGAALAGPLADKVFEPAMAQPGLFQTIFSKLVGTGPGSGMSLLILFTGALTVIAVAIGFSLPILRNVDTLIPDFDEVPAHSEGAEETTAS